MKSSVVIVCFSLFLILFLGVGALAARVSTNKDESDYLLGNRSFGKLFIGLSAGATSNSGWIMIGAVGFAYSTGTYALLLLSRSKITYLFLALSSALSALSAVFYRKSSTGKGVMWLGYLLGDMLFWSLFPDKINQISQQQNSQTVPELLGLSIKNPQGKRLITTIVALITLVIVGAYTAAQFGAAAKTLNAFFGIEPKLGAASSAFSILTYCVSGGIRASIWTDVVQAFVVMFVSYSMLVIAIMAGGGVGEIITQLNNIDPQLVNFTINKAGWTLVAFVCGFIAAGVGFNLSQPQFLVRLMSGKNPEEVRQAKWIYLGFVYSTYLAMVLFGIISRVLLPNLTDPEQALPVYAMENLHPILVGVVLAGIFSIIASTADSQILVCSSALARDIAPNFYHRMSRKYGLRYQQFMTLLVGIATLIASIFISSTVFGLILFAVGALAGSIAPAMLITIIKRRTHSTALSSMMLVGLATAIGWRLLGFNTIINESVPGIIIALIFHEILMRTCFKLKRSV